MKDIFVFSHNYLVNSWFEIVDEQLTLLFKSGLYDAAEKIYYCVYSDDEFQIYKFTNLVKKFDKNKKINIVIHPYNDCEKNTISFLQNICRHYDNIYVLYYHTKGVTSTNRPEHIQRNVKSWRQIMNFYNIEKWKNHIRALNDNYDISGVLYSNGYYPNINEPKPTFFGNFWWASSNYINKLPSVENLDNRMGMETWITSIPHNWASAQYPWTGDIYNVYFDTEKYINDV